MAPQKPNIIGGYWKWLFFGKVRFHGRLPLCQIRGAMDDSGPLPYCEGVVPKFWSQHDHIEKILAWVRIPGLPIEYYNQGFLWKVGKKIGRPVRVDQATRKVTRGKFARLCVEVDITKPLLSKFKLRRVRRIELICFKWYLWSSENGVPHKSTPGTRSANWTQNKPLVENPHQMLEGGNPSTPATVNLMNSTRTINSKIVDLRCMDDGDTQK